MKRKLESHDVVYHGVLIPVNRDMRRTTVENDDVSLSVNLDVVDKITVGP